MTKNELLQQLYIAENTAQALKPYTDQQLQLTNTKSDLEKRYNAAIVERDDAKKQIPLYLGIAVGCFLLTFLDFFFSFLFYFLVIGGVVCAIGKVISLFSNSSEAKRLEKEIAQANHELTVFHNQLIQKRQEFAAGLHILQTMMPQECLIPRYARVFNYFIETDQATTLPEARRMFDEYLHREKMESIASQQLTAARNAELAMMQASANAARAAAAAESAASAANRTSQIMNCNRP